MGLMIGWARCSTVEHYVDVQRAGSIALGVPKRRVYVDHGYASTNRVRPGLREALAACRDGDTLVVTKLDRLARSVVDARAIIDEISAAGARFQIGSSVHDPNDPVDRLLFTALSMVAEFEADLIRARTREGMAIAKAKGWLRERAPKITSAQRAHLLKLHGAGEHTSGELAELFGVSRATVYRTVERTALARWIRGRASSSHRSARPLRRHARLSLDGWRDVAPLCVG